MSERLEPPGEGNRLSNCKKEVKWRDSALMSWAPALHPSFLRSSVAPPGHLQPPHLQETQTHRPMLALGTAISNRPALVQKAVVPPPPSLQEQKHAPLGSAVKQHSTLTHSTFGRRGRGQGRTACSDCENEIPGEISKVANSNCSVNVRASHHKFYVLSASLGLDFRGKWGIMGETEHLWPL